MKALGYFRQPQTARSGDSIAHQNRAFLDYCESQGYEVASTFAEENDSGAGFAKLVDYLKRPEKGFVVVVAQSPAALADEPAGAAARCFQIERLGAKVQFVDEEGDALGVILAGLTAAQGETISEKVKSALRRKAVRGEVLGRPPYGYKVGSHNRLELVEEEAVVIRYIFRLYLHEGLGIRLIARRLNEEGLRTRRERPWSMVSIRDILRNRAYLGTYQRLGVRVPGTHPALVSPDDFRRVQERLSDRRTNYSPRNASAFLLSTLAYCGHCGNRMIGVSRRQAWRRRRDGSEQAASYRYYQCESRTNQGICGYHTHRAEELEEIVREKLATLDPRQLASAGDDAALITEWQAEARRLHERLLTFDRRISQSLEAAARDQMSIEKLRSAGSALADERLKTEDALRDARWRAEHYASAAERRRTRNAALDLLVAQWADLSLAERQQLLRELVDRIVVTDEDITVSLRP
jgi:DNA invertase Pin-like site-specific DNA recombinase